MEQGFKEFCILELMGHRKLAGLVSEQTIGGASFIRLDVPGQDGKIQATQLYSPAAVYCITPVSEEVARAFAKSNIPEPVTIWELQLPTSGASALSSPMMRAEDVTDGE